MRIPAQSNDHRIGSFSSVKTERPTCLVTQPDPFFNLTQHMISPSALATPDALALEILGPEVTGCLQTKWSYHELERDISCLAHGLKNAGIKQGERVLLRLHSNITFVFSFFASIAIGAIPVPVSPKATAKELAFYLNDTNAAWILKGNALNCLSDIKTHQIDEAKIWELIDQAKNKDDWKAFNYAQTKREDPAFLIYTSGTTSWPKGVLHAQRVIKGREPMRDGWHDIRHGDRVLHAGDLNWTYTIGVGLMDTWTGGATACLYQGEKSRTIWPSIIKTLKPTIFAAVPGVYRQTLKYSDLEAEDLASLRHGLSAGEELPVKLKRDWQEATGCPLYEAMGQSEISTYVSTAPGLKVPEGAKGRIQPGRKVVILPPIDPDNPHSENEGINPLKNGEIGMIAIHQEDPGLMLGYWREHRPVRENFRGPWFLTGDLGSIDHRGNLTHHGRADELMNPSGYRVSPREVEAVLHQLEQIEDAAVFARQIRPDLNIISALLVMKTPPENREMQFKLIKQHMAENLAPFKQPKDYELVDELPRNKAGKLIRSQLPELFQKAGLKSL